MKRSIECKFLYNAFYVKKLIENNKNLSPEIKGSLNPMQIVQKAALFAHEMSSIKNAIEQGPICGCRIVKNGCVQGVEV